MKKTKPTKEEAPREIECDEKDEIWKPIEEKLEDYL